MAARVILITGANTGLGLEIVRALCSSHERYEILLAGRSYDKAIQAVADLAIAFPETKTKLQPIQVDIEDDDSIVAAFDTVKETYGRLDVLVNNAGNKISSAYSRKNTTLIIPGAQFDQQLQAGNMTMRQIWNQTWNVNTAGTQIMTSIFVPLLLQSTDPRLLFITSGTSTLAGSENLDLPINRVPAKGWPKSGPPQSNVPAYRSAKTGLNMMMR